MHRIAENAKVYVPLFVAEGCRVSPGYGFDAREKQLFNMLDQGIVDPHDGRQAFPGTRRRLLHATDH